MQKSESNGKIPTLKNGAFNRGRSSTLYEYAEPRNVTVFNSPATNSLPRLNFISAEIIVNKKQTHTVTRSTTHLARALPRTAALPHTATLPHTAAPCRTLSQTAATYLPHTAAH
jgi:hypothetical protein